MLDFASSAIITLLVTIDPFALAPIFLSLTLGMTTQERRRVGLRACIIAFAILAFFGLGGSHVLDLLGVGLPAFRISGGVLLFCIAFEMVFERSSERNKHTAQTAITEDHIHNVAAFPLGIPLLAGPGAITATILLAGRAHGDAVTLSLLLALIALCILMCFAVFLTAERLSRMLGVTGNIVLSRLLGVILGGLSVQYVIDGILAIFRT